MDDLSLVRDFSLMLITGLTGGVIAKKFRFPLVIGYILSGICFKVLFSGLLVSESAVRNIAEIGIAFLLFTLGLEFSLRKLKEVGMVIVTGALLQILITTSLLLGVFMIFRTDFYTSLFLGVVFSLSSTAVAIKMLGENGELESVHGELASGLLFMQDLFTLPIMIILPEIGKSIYAMEGISTAFTVIRSLAVGLLSFLVILGIGKRIMPYLVEKITSLKSRELTLLFSITVCLILAFIFKLSGFSFAIGAFIAGILIASSSVKYGIFAEIRPVRDIFSVIFFVSLGLIIQPTFLVINIGRIVSFSLIILVLKFVITSAVMMGYGFHSRTSAMVGFSLVSVGEFAFIIANFIAAAGYITDDVYMMVISVTMFTILASTPVQHYGQNIYSFYRDYLRRKLPRAVYMLKKLEHASVEISEQLKHEVLVLGYGRVGKYICRALSMLEIPYAVVDNNIHIVNGLRQSGVLAYYGDPADIDVLRFARLHQVKTVIVAYFDRMMQEKVIANIITVNPNAKIFCRIHFEEDQHKLKALGVNCIIQPEFEAALSITERLLNMYNISQTEIDGKIARLKIEHGLG